MRRACLRDSILTFILAAVLALSAGLGVSCAGDDGDASIAEADALGVAVTIAPLADFVENVGGEHVDVTIMVPPGASPHSHQPTQRQLKELCDAEVYVKVGSGVDFELAYMDTLTEQNPDMLLIDCSVGIELIGGDDSDHDDDGHHHEGNDPHIWNSPVNAKKMVENICEGLMKADPDHAADYQANRDLYLQDLDDLDAYIHDQLDSASNRYFMTYHPSFGYFAEEYDLTQLAIEHDGKAPTGPALDDCIKEADENNLSYVFVAPQFATDHAEEVAKRIGGHTAFIDPLGEIYIDNMKDVADSIALELE
jgi:zinc transport system substrate-binding protein